jgi:putative transposase
MTDTFIHEIQLKTTPRDEAVLAVRLEAARNLYNACLRESLRRLDLMRESKAYQSARELPKGKSRNEAFKTCRDGRGFLEYTLHPFAAGVGKSCWIGDHLDAFTIQRIGLMPSSNTPTVDVAGRGLSAKAGSPLSKEKAMPPAFVGVTAKFSGAVWRSRRSSTSRTSMALKHMHCPAG